MAEARNRKLVRQLLKKILKDERKAAVPVVSGVNAYMRAYRRNLKGSVQERTACIKRANDYLAQLKLAPEVKRELPPSLNATVNECRKVGGSIRLTCVARMQAIDKLLFLEGIPVPQTDDATWQYIHRELGTAAPVPEPESEKLARLYRLNRDENYRGALEQIRKNYLQDLSEGRFRGMTAEQVCQWLRLDKMDPAPIPKAASLAETHKAELQGFLDRL